MKRYSKSILCCMVIVAGLYYGGKMDREEHAILTMSQQEYDGIRDSLQNINGITPSDDMIAGEWYAKKGE